MSGSRGWGWGGGRKVHFLKHSTKCKNNYFPSFYRFPLQVIKWRILRLHIRINTQVLKKIRHSYNMLQLDLEWKEWGLSALLWMKNVWWKATIKLGIIPELLFKFLLEICLLLGQQTLSRIFVLSYVRICIYGIMSRIKIFFCF